MSTYDYLIVGTGWTGCTLAHELCKAGARVLVVDKKGHVGGLQADYMLEGVPVGRYGLSLFRTGEQKIWDYAAQFGKLRPVRFGGRAITGGAVYPYPVNLQTICTLYGVTNPEDARRAAMKDCKRLLTPTNAEDWAMVNIGTKIYERFIKAVLIKLTGKQPTSLPVSFAKAFIPSYTFNEDYYPGELVGVFEQGSSDAMLSMLEGAELVLGADFVKEQAQLAKMAKRVVYTEEPSELMNYKFGTLDYRTVELYTEVLQGDVQGGPFIVYTDEGVPYFLSLDHAKLFRDDSKISISSMVYVSRWEKGKEAVLPVRTKQNLDRAAMYQKAAGPYILTGPLCDYQHYTVGQMVSKALLLAKELQN